MLKKAIWCLFMGTLGAIGGLILCIAATPLWWKLESATDLELAGHSGPSEWLLLLFASVFGVFTAWLTYHLQTKSAKAVANHISK